MRLIAIACQVLMFAALAMCQASKSQPEQLHLTIGSPGEPVTLTASNIDRDLSSRASESILRLKGNVEIRTACHYTGPEDMRGCDGSVVIHADSAEYNEQTGEVHAHGDVRIEPNHAR